MVMSKYSKVARLKKQLQYLLFLSALVPVSSLKADVLLSFDDIFVAPGKTIVIPNNYHFLDWDGLFITNTQGVAAPSGFLNGTVSPPNVAVLHTSAEFYSPTQTAFDLASADFTSGGYDDQSVTVDGFLGGLGGTLEDTVTFTINPNAPTLEVFDWDDIDAVSITTSGGTPAPGYQFGPGYLAIDNLDLPLLTGPEPATWFLIFPPLALIFLLRRKAFLRRS